MTTERTERSRDHTTKVIFGGARTGTRPIWFKPVQLNLWRKPNGTPQAAQGPQAKAIDEPDTIRPEGQTGARK
jgi:hypothetical protein